MVNSWIKHLKEFYAKNKGKMSYKQAMKEAKKTYKGESKSKSKPKAKSKAKKVENKTDDITKRKLERDALIQERLKKREAIDEVKEKLKTLGTTAADIEVIEEKAKLKKLLGGRLEPKKPSKEVRAQIVRKYTAIKKAVQDALNKGQLPQKIFNDFMRLSKFLAGGSKTNKYAKDGKRIEKAFNSKKYEKAKASKEARNPITKATQKQFENLQRLLARSELFTAGLETRMKKEQTVADRKKRFIALQISLGKSQEEAEKLWEKVKDVQTKDVSESLRVAKEFESKENESYQDFLKRIKKEKGFTHKQAQQFAKGRYKKKKSPKPQRKRRATAPSIPTQEVDLGENLGINISEVASEFRQADGSLKPQVKRDVKTILNKIINKNMSDEQLEKFFLTNKKTDFRKANNKIRELILKYDSSVFDEPNKNEFNKIKTFISTLPQKIQQEKLLKEQQRTTQATQRAAATAQIAAPANVPLIAHATTPPVGLIATHNPAPVINFAGMTPAELETYHHSTVTSGIRAENDPASRFTTEPETGGVRFRLGRPYITSKKELIDKLVNADDFSYEKAMDNGLINSGAYTGDPTTIMDDGDRAAILKKILAERGLDPAERKKAEFGLRRLLHVHGFDQEVDDRIALEENAYRTTLVDVDPSNIPHHHTPDPRGMANDDELDFRNSDQDLTGLSELFVGIKAFDMIMSKALQPALEAQVTALSAILVGAFNNIMNGTIDTPQVEATIRGMKQITGKDFTSKDFTFDDSQVQILTNVLNEAPNYTNAAGENLLDKFEDRLGFVIDNNIVNAGVDNINPVLTILKQAFQRSTPVRELVKGIGDAVKKNFPSTTKFYRTGAGLNIDPTINMKLYNNPNRKKFKKESHHLNTSKFEENTHKNDYDPSQLLQLGGAVPVKPKVKKQDVEGKVQQLKEQIIQLRSAANTGIGDYQSRRDNAFKHIIDLSKDIITAPRLHRNQYIQAKEHLKYIDNNRGKVGGAILGGVPTPKSVSILGGVPTPTGGSMTAADYHKHFKKFGKHINC